MPNSKKKKAKSNKDWQGFYSTAQVSRLARVPRSTLYEWKSRGIIRPSISVFDENNNLADAGYSYADLTIIRLIRAIRDKKLNLRSVSVALRHLVARFGQPSNGWHGVHVYIVNNNVYADQPDEWEITEATRHGQKVETRLLNDVFDVLRNMDEDGDILVPRGFSQCIAIKPNVMGGDPVIKGTRIPTAAIAAKFRKGASIDRLFELYQPVSRECIEKAIDYEKYLSSPLSQAGKALTRR